MKSLIFTLLLATSAFAQNQNATVKFNPPPIFGKTNYFSQPYFAIDPNLSSKPKPIFYTYSPTLNGYLGLGSANPRLQLDNMYKSVKIDSFNPNGACDMVGALVSGTFNLIFNGNNGTSAYIRL